MGVGGLPEGSQWPDQHTGGLAIVENKCGAGETMV